MCDVIGASEASKVCASCRGRYPGDALFCPSDGSPLQSAAAAERDEVDPYVGQEISGHIEIQQLIGVGAMGRVYRAFQRGIDRDVAVKILHRELSANAQLVSRFTREAKVASRLQHPNVVQVLLAGQLPDRAVYMVMEYLDGLSLQSALAASGGAMPLRRALHVALQLCDAVGEAHAKGIVHRDLKPENVMLVRRGADPDFVKVLDFGIARIDWGEQSVATAAGLIFGTARYISPEGAQGNPVGPTGDVYAIGTLVYQLLAGRTPFDGDQAVGLLVQQIHDAPPDLRSHPLAAGVPDPIADVVMASLAKAPAEREPDARALGEALFAAARRAGLSPDELSSPLLRTPGLGAAARVAAPPARGSSGGEPSERAPVASTVKWEPPAEFHARLAEASRPAAPSPSPQTVIDGAGRRSGSNVDATIDDMVADALESRSSPLPTPAPSGASPALRAPLRTAPGDVGGRGQTAYETPGDVGGRGETAYETSGDVGGRGQTAYETLGDGDGRGQTAYETPGDGARPRHTAYEAPAHAPGAPLRVASKPESPRAPSYAASAEEPAGGSRGWLIIVLCFALGAALAAGWAWSSGRFGGDDAERDRLAARAADALREGRIVGPAGDSVRDLTDEGLRRWPSDRRLLDLRASAASALLSEARALRASGDVAEATERARRAQELDPSDGAAARFIEACEVELASAAPSAAPPLPAPPSATPAKPKPPAPPPATAPSPPPAPVPTPSPTPTPAPRPERVPTTAAMEVSVARPRVGQSVELLASVMPLPAALEAPGFTIIGPGVPGGLRVPAQQVGPGLFKASYAFLEAGRFDVTFSAQADGRVVAARRGVTALAPDPPPAPTGSVKWM